MTGVVAHADLENGARVRKNDAQTVNKLKLELELAYVGIFPAQDNQTDRAESWLSVWLWPLKKWTRAWTTGS